MALGWDPPLRKKRSKYFYLFFNQGNSGSTQNQCTVYFSHVISSLWVFASLHLHVCCRHSTWDQTLRCNPNLFVPFAITTWSWMLAIIFVPVPKRNWFQFSCILVSTIMWLWLTVHSALSLLTPFDIVLSERQGEEGRKSQFKFIALWKTEMTKWEVEMERKDLCLSNIKAMALHK